MLVRVSPHRDALHPLGRAAVGGGRVLLEVRPGGSAGVLCAPALPCPGWQTGIDTAPAWQVADFAAVAPWERGGVDLSVRRPFTHHSPRSLPAGGCLRLPSQGCPPSSVNPVSTSTFGRRQGGSPMGTYRQKIAASLTLLAVVLAFFAGTVLLRPRPASAAGNRQRKFDFGPVYLAQGQPANFLLTNTGTLPTPPATVVFSDSFSGLVLDSTTLPSVPPGGGSGRGIEGAARYTRVVVTFDRPGAAQSIPSPFAGTVVVLDGFPVKPTVVLQPAR